MVTEWQRNQDHNFVPKSTRITIMYDSKCTYTIVHAKHCELGYETSDMVYTRKRTSVLYVASFNSNIPSATLTPWKRRESGSATLISGIKRRGQQPVGSLRDAWLADLYGFISWDSESTKYRYCLCGDQPRNENSSSWCQDCHISHGIFNKKKRGKGRERKTSCDVPFQWLLGSNQSMLLDLSSWMGVGVVLAHMSFWGGGAVRCLGALILESRNQESQESSTSLANIERSFARNKFSYSKNDYIQI